jgi:hypothetical protein
MSIVKASPSQSYVLFFLTGCAQTRRGRRRHGHARGRGVRPSCARFRACACRGILRSVYERLRTARWTWLLVARRVAVAVAVVNGSGDDISTYIALTRASTIDQSHRVNGPALEAVPVQSTPSKGRPCCPKKSKTDGLPISPKVSFIRRLCEAIAPREPIPRWFQKIVLALFRVVRHARRRSLPSHRHKC